MFKTFLFKHDVGTTANDPIAIELNIIGYHTIEQFLEFEDNGDVANEMEYYDNGSGTN